jgi:hypothetical protein
VSWKRPTFRHLKTLHVNFGDRTFPVYGFLNATFMSQVAKKTKPIEIMPSTKIQFQRSWYSIVMPPFQSIGRKGVRQATRGFSYLLPQSNTIAQERDQWGEPLIYDEERDTFRGEKCPWNGPGG